MRRRFAFELRDASERRCVRSLDSFWARGSPRHPEERRCSRDRADRAASVRDSGSVFPLASPKREQIDQVTDSRLVRTRRKRRSIASRKTRNSLTGAEDGFQFPRTIGSKSVVWRFRSSLTCCYCLNALESVLAAVQTVHHVGCAWEQSSRPVLLPTTVW